MPRTTNPTNQEQVVLDLKGNQKGMELINSLKERYSEDESLTRPMTSFPIIQIMNTERERYGLFAKQSELDKAAWKGSDDNGLKYSHVYKSGSKDKIQGRLFQKVAMHIIDVSPRLIEVTDAGMRAYRDGASELQFLAEKGITSDGKSKKPIIGVYADKHGFLISQEIKSFYDSLKAQGWVTLRTYYLVKLLEKTPDGYYKEAHQVPFCLPIHGAAAMSFGQALTKLGVNFSGVVGLDLHCPTVEGLSPIVFDVTFNAELAGNDESSSYVTIVESFEEITLDNINQLYRTEVVQEFEDIRKVNNNFAYHYAIQCANEWNVHQIAAGVDLQQLKPAKPIGLIEAYDGYPYDANLD